MFGTNIKRKLIDSNSTVIMIICLGFVVITPVLIAIGLGWKSAPILSEVPPGQLLFTSVWEPGKGHFGFLAYILSSILITLLAILIAGPFCLLTAIYLTQYARKSLIKLMQPVIDILAGIPSVVYGVWGILLIVPFIADRLAPLFGVQSTGYSLLAGGIVLAVMVIPFILNILIEIFRTFPLELSEATLSLGATKWEVIKHVLLRKTKPGIISAFGLGISRAFGETMAVLMVAGNVARLPRNPFEPVYPLPALIANNYGEMMSIPLYDSALMVAALLLFLAVISFNALSRMSIYRLEKNL